MMILCDEGTSFLDKIDRSPKFLFKFIFVEIFASLALAGAEWWYETRRLEITVDVPGFQKHILFRLMRRTMFYGIYFLAAFTVILNVTLIFDNVLWGDEAYSANLVRHNLPDMMQIISLTEPHPPLYYYWLKMWVELLGHSGTVFSSGLPAGFYTRPGIDGDFGQKAIRKDSGILLYCVYGNV